MVQGISDEFEAFCKQAKSVASQNMMSKPAHGYTQTL